MKCVVLCFVAIFAVVSAEVDFLATTIPNEIEFRNQDPYSFQISMHEIEEGHLVDDQVILERTLGRNFISDTIEKALEDFRDVVINGNESIPPLDPLVIDKIGPYEYTITGVRAKATVNNFRAVGLAWYVVDHVTFNPLRLTFGTKMTLPWMTVTGAYAAEARIALFLTHKAGGNFRVFINRFEVGVDARLGTSIFGGHLLLRNLDIKLDIADLIIQIDGMTGSSIINTFINAFVQSLTQEIIQNHLDDISQIISEAVFDTVNDFLKDFTLADITY